MFAKDHQLYVDLYNDDYHEFYGTWDPESQCERGKFSKKMKFFLKIFLKIFVNPNFLILSWKISKINVIVMYTLSFLNILDYFGLNESP